MRLYLQQNVFDAALDRIRRLYDEFPHVLVAMSGGKDSTVVMQLALQVAREKNRLPLQVLFADQEAEWSFTIDYIRQIRDMPDVELLWYQIPISIANNASGDSNFVCWGEGVKWMRDKEPGAIHEADIGTSDWYDMFPAIFKQRFPTEKACLLTGIRAEESPRRNLGLTGIRTYQDITWGLIFDKALDHYNFSPLYDWSLTDIWVAIHRNKWSYCQLYDEMYALGTPLRDMRLSSLHHETALQSLIHLQEIDRETWEKVVDRIPGANTIKHLCKEAFQCPKKLPPMFDSWMEYRDHLLKYMVPGKEEHQAMQKHFAKMERKYAAFPDKDKMYRVQARTALVNDQCFTLCRNWEAGPFVQGWYAWSKGKDRRNHKDNPFVKMSVEAAA